MVATVIPKGLLISARFAGPLSPEKPAFPVPATTLNRPFGRRAVLRREQETFRRGVLFHGAMKIQMIARQIGEDSGVEVEPMHSPQRQRVICVKISAVPNVKRSVYSGKRR